MTLRRAILLGWLGSAAAWAQEDPDAERGARPPVVEPPWYAGLPVASVRLLSPEGGLPEESLDPLLHVRSGDPVDPQLIRQDLSTLFQVGEFSAVEADVEPWVQPDESGEPQPAALVTYRVYEAPKVEKVRFQGLHAVREREVLEAAHIAPGMVFYAELDGPAAEQALAEVYRRKGYPRAEVHVETGENGSPALDVTIRVDEGLPDTVARLSFAGDLPVAERTLRRWARKAELSEDAPLSEEALADSQREIRRKLARMGPLRGRHGGWVEARVTAVATGDGQGGNNVTVSIEPGERLVLDVEGLDWLPRTKMHDALAIDERARLTRGFLEAAPERIEEYLQVRGFYAAKAEVSLDVDPVARVQTLHILVDRGPPHRLERDPEVMFVGNQAIRDSVLETVMDQASDEVLRFNRVTQPEIAVALTAIRDRYRAEGYLDAKVALDSLEVSDDLRFGVRSIALRIRVEEGSLTELVGLDLAGFAKEADRSVFEAARAEMVGTPEEPRPFSPQALEALARQVVEAHRRVGYVEADARVVREVVGIHRMTARIVVDAGPLVLLRSVVTRGARHTRPATIRREIEMELGQPVTSTDLDRMRRSLYDLGIFHTVSAQLLGDEQARDMVLNVEERPLWAFEIGGGLSTDHGLRSFGRVTRRNLWGRAHGLELYGLLGVEWLRDFLPDILDPEWRLALSYRAPHFPARPQVLVLEILLRERRQERTWQLSRSGVGIALETRIGRTTTVRTGARVESRRLEEVDLGALLDGEIWVDLVDRLDPVLPTVHRAQESLTVLLLQDFRDNPLTPTKGVLLSVLGEWAPGISLLHPQRRGVSFLKGQARATALVPMAGLGLKVSGEVGRAWMLGDGVLPLEDRFFLGGTGSVRGYRRDGIGPHNEVELADIRWPDQLAPLVDYAAREDPTRWVSAGGDTEAAFVFELDVPWTILGPLRAWDGWALGLFADLGNVWLLDPEARATTDLEPWRSRFRPPVRYGTGIGLRVATPVGPLQVDLAANPALIAASPETRAFLREDLQESPFRFHLSLGAL